MVSGQRVLPLGSPHILASSKIVLAPFYSLQRQPAEVAIAGYGKYDGVCYRVGE